MRKQKGTKKEKKKGININNMYRGPVSSTKSREARFTVYAANNSSFRIHSSYLSAHQSIRLSLSIQTPRMHLFDHHRTSSPTLQRKSLDLSRPLPDGLLQSTHLHPHPLHLLLLLLPP